MNIETSEGAWGKGDRPVRYRDIMGRNSAYEDIAKNWFNMLYDLHMYPRYLHTYNTIKTTFLMCAKEQIGFECVSMTADDFVGIYRSTRLAKLLQQKLEHHRLS